MQKLRDLERSLEFLTEIAGSAMVMNPGLSVVLAIARAELSGTELGPEALSKATSINGKSLERYTQHLNQTGIIEFVEVGTGEARQTLVKMSSKARETLELYFKQ